MPLADPDDRSWSAPGPPNGAGPAPRRRGRRGRAVLALVAVAAAVTGGALGARWLADELRAPFCEFRVADRTEQLTPEQAANAATIAMVAVDRGLSPRAATIALATAIQESKLRNLTYGDADSLGLFQQRPSQGWGTAEEVRDPIHASDAFYDALVQVPGWESGEVTVVAQAVQRSAFPDAYADHEWEGRVLASVLTGHSPGGIGCELEEVTTAGSPEQVLAKAQHQFAAAGERSGNTVRLTMSDPSAAWAAASWAVAHAGAEGIVAVNVDGRRWERAAEPLVWRAGPTGFPAGSVVIELA